MLTVRVVSPQLFLFFLNFPENCWNDFIGNFLPLQTFQITAHLLTTMLLKGFYTTLLTVLES